MNWLKAHPYEAAGIALVALGAIIVVLRRSGGGAVADNSLQLAQLSASSNLQAAQLAAQQQVAQSSAQVQNNELQAALAANEQNSVAQIVGGVIAGQQSLQGQGIQASVINQQLADELQVAQTNQAIQQAQQSSYFGALQTALRNGSNAGLNQLALLTGQGNIGSFNQTNEQTHANNLGFFGGIIHGLLGFL